jgi:hypothetical protein
MLLGLALVAAAAGERAGGGATRAREGEGATAAGLQIRALAAL